jgi:hypothetical protein
LALTPNFFWGSDRPSNVSGLFDRPQDGFRLPGDHVEQHQRRAARLAVAAFPVAQRPQADGKSRGELFLRETSALAVTDSLAQSSLDALE